MYTMHGFPQVGKVATSFCLRDKSISRHINSKNKTRRDQNTSGSVFIGMDRFMGKNNDTFNRFSNPRFVGYFLQLFGSLSQVGMYLPRLLNKKALIYLFARIGSRYLDNLSNDSTSHIVQINMHLSVPGESNNDAFLCTKGHPKSICGAWAGKN